MKLDQQWKKTTLGHEWHPISLWPTKSLMKKKKAIQKQESRPSSDMGHLEEDEGYTGNLDRGPVPDQRGGNGTSWQDKRLTATENPQKDRST